MDYQKVYNDLISKRKEFPLKKSKDLYTELHHIVPRCLGGTDESSNLVRLTAREHFIAHRLLAKIYIGNSDLSLSVLFMMKVQGGTIHSSREIARLKELTSNAASEISLALWEDPTYRTKVAKSKKKFFDSLEEGYWSERQKIAMNTDPETKIKLSVAAKKQFQEPSNREQMSEIKKQHWENKRVADNILEAQRKFLGDNPWAWQRPRAQPTRHLWTLAATLWELRYGEGVVRSRCAYSAVRFSKEFSSGKHSNVFHKMICLFKEGWVPRECPAYLEEFGDRM